MVFRFSGTRMALVVLCVGFSIAMLGCGVSQDDFDKVSKERDQVQQQLTDLKAKYESQSKDVEAMSNDLQTARKKNSDLEKANKTLTERANTYKKLLKEKAPDVDLKALDKPAPTGKFKEYEVKEGDSLWSIAQANNSSVDEIKEANGMEDIKLKLGQTLKIPVKGN